MKKILFSIFLFAIMLSAVAQETNATEPAPFMKGVLNIKLRNEYPLDFKADSTNSINVKDIKFLKKMAKKYGITHIGQNYNLNDDPILLRTLTISFSKTELTDKFIEKLKKNKNVEWVEQLPVKKALKNMPVQVQKRR